MKILHATLSKYIQKQRQVNLLLSNKKTWHSWWESFSFNWLPLLICLDWLRFWLEGFMLDFWTILKKSFGTWCDLWPTIFNKSFFSGIRFLPLLSVWKKSQVVSGKNPNIGRMNLHIFEMIDFDSSWQWIIFLCWTKVLFNIFFVWVVLQLIRSVNTSVIFRYDNMNYNVLNDWFYLFSVQCFFGTVLV